MCGPDPGMNQVKSENFSFSRFFLSILNRCLDGVLNSDLISDMESFLNSDLNCSLIQYPCPKLFVDQ